MNLDGAPEHDFDTPPETEFRTRLLLLYTGGTIGMKSSEKGYKPVPGYVSKLSGFYFPVSTLHPCHAHPLHFTRSSPLCYQNCRNSTIPPCRMV